MKFKEFAQNSENQAELQRIWGDTFKSLGVGGLSDEDAAQQSLSKITFGSRNPDRANSTFKGKQAVRKRLEKFSSDCKKSTTPKFKRVSKTHVNGSIFKTVPSHIMPVLLSVTCCKKCSAKKTFKISLTVISLALTLPKLRLSLKLPSRLIRRWVRVKCNRDRHRVE
jgi:hypothetical protein